MDKNTNKYIAVAYKLYEDGTENLIEEATAEKPFIYLSGFGMALDEFEKATATLQKGENFEFSLTKEQAYGEHDPKGVLELDREMFCIDGKLDSEHIFEGAIIPLQNESGQRFPAKVTEIGDSKVTVDLNHPLAGKGLHFTGSIIEAREATKEEIQSIVNHMNGGCSNCGGGCEGGCEGGCGGCH